MKSTMLGSGRHERNMRSTPLIISILFIAFVFAFNQVKMLVFVSNSSLEDTANSITKELLIDQEEDNEVEAESLNTGVINALANEDSDVDEESDNINIKLGIAENDAIKDRIDKKTANDPDQSEGKTLNDKKKKMNILVFYADDWRFDSIGALNPLVHTPNLNKLAKEGMIFPQNAVTTSICWISRATLATGQHYARHKTKNIWDPVPFHKHWNETVFGKLTQEGYFTGSVGKWQPGSHQPYMFNVSTNYWGWHYDENNVHITDRNEQDAMDFLTNKRKNVDDPFALFVNFFAPHHHDGQVGQYFPQNKTKHLYHNITVPFAPTCTDEAWKKMPPFIDESNEGRIRWHHRFDEPAKAQIMMKNYYRLISGVDMTVGTILAELERQNQTENTMIIFTTDNGYYHAEHGLADKFYAHQESIRVPLIIKDPRMKKELMGTRNDELTLSIDLAPTILQAADINIPDRMQGVDISPLYRVKGTGKEMKEWRRSFYYEFPGITDNSALVRVQALVKKDDYKYIYWPDHKYEELFHLPSDRYEEHDLARNGTFEWKLKELREEFKKAQADAQ